MKLDCVKCTKCGKVHSVSRGCEPLSSGAVLAEVRAILEKRSWTPNGYHERTVVDLEMVMRILSEHFR